MDFDNQVNKITIANLTKLGLNIQPTNVRAQKIDISIFETLKIVLASFEINNKLLRSQFFQETFLLVNTNKKVVLGICFLTFKNADKLFTKRELI